jgi:hypothetical protein
MFEHDNSDFDLPDPDISDTWLFGIVVVVLSFVAVFLMLGLWKLFDFIRPFLN